MKNEDIPDESKVSLLIFLFIIFPLLFVFDIINMLSSNEKG